MEISRRGLLAGAAVGGGLLLAWSFQPRSFPTPLVPGKDEVAFDAWLKIARDGVITVAVPQVEMGQGVTTVLPQIVAMELGADWRQIAVEPAPVSGVYANVPLAAKWAPLWMPSTPELANEADDLLAIRYAQDNRFAVTADGMSLAAYEPACREAAASARAMLAMAAADRWDAEWEQCQARSGFIFYGDKHASFAELAEEAAQYSPPDPPPVMTTPPSEPVSELGLGAALAYPRLDLPAKVDGSFQFAGDVRLPGMVHAAIRHGPIDKATLSRFSKEKSAGMRGLVGVVEGKRWLAAVAENWWTAEQALVAMDPQFRLSSPINSSDISDRLDTALRGGDARRIATRGDGDALMVKPDLALRYDVAPADHNTLETASATARLEDGLLELWMASQAPEAARRAAASALGISPRNVILYPMPAGGSFDRRLESDHAIEAALIARETKRPVQLTWSRWQEHLRTRPRTPVAALLTAVVGEEGAVSSMRIRIAAPASAREFGHRLFDNATSWAAMERASGEADPMVAEGAMPPYGIPNVAVDHVPTDIGLPTGRMRGNSHGYTAFFVESFIDELAARNLREPLSYRIQMLGGDLRLAECLQRAARLGEWDGGLEKSGKGLACHLMGPAPADDEGGTIASGRIACIATASPGAGGVRVAKLAAVVDIGRIVNVDIARQQIEGGLIFGLGLALGETAEYIQGLPTIGRIAQMGLPVLADCPEIAVQFVSSDKPPFDPGELGVAVVAPAIANALHSATGVRFRNLPLLSDRL
ncbi:xanthine dehydrogenase family protein molybdopterin-binding subunit [Altererythrobacter aquiaggeris]|uniref:xanthine dehydrogenase family protein molybdopterin-binding subunit n=1 Tax=Aestuarierythrobacter aquiaggeris TaxID=1898396 RepID=UPI0030186174